MAKNGKMQQVVMRVLATMLVVSFLLAVVSFVFPQRGLAYSCWREWACREDWSCTSHEAWGYRWCCSNSSPPCGPWNTNCYCPH